MALVKKRDHCKNELSLALSWAKEDCKSATLSDVVKRVDELDLQYVAFEEAHRNVIDVLGPSELDFQNLEGDDAASIYKQARAAMVVHIEKLKKSSLAAPSGVYTKTRSKSAERITKTKAPPIDFKARGGFNWAEDVTNSAIGNPPPSSVHQGAGDMNNGDAVGNRGDREANNFAAGIIRLSNWAAHTTAAETTIDMARSRANLLEDYWQKFTAVAFSGDPIDFGELVDNTEISYLQAKADLCALINSYAPRNDNARAAGAVAPQQEIPLPRIEIPKFSGDFNTWLSFYDLFVSMVDNNPALDGVKKMHYLRSCLEGEAEQLIRSYKLTDANYAEAWNALRARYNNRRLIVNAHLDQLFDMALMKGESSENLRRHLDKFTEAVRGLTALEQPVEHWNVILTHLFVSKLDTATKHAWEMSLGSDEIPTFAQLSAFIEKRCRSLVAAGQDHATKTSRNCGDIRYQPGYRASANVIKPRTFLATQSDDSSTQSSTTNVCVLCSGDHFIAHCKTFAALVPKERYHKAKDLGLCFNCLRSEHTTAKCRSGMCRKCNRRHHTMLHYDNETSHSETAAATTTLLGMNDNRNVFLATAMAIIESKSGQHHAVRIVLDGGSQTSFITELCVKRLCIRPENVSLPISGIDAASIIQTRGRVNLAIRPSTGKCDPFHVNAFVLANITNALPNAVMARNNISFINMIPLFADSQFDQPGDVDILLGGDILGDLLREGQMHDVQNRALYAQNTAFGWVIAGPIPCSQ